VNQLRLWRFPGGLRLDGHKRESTRLPLQTAHLPAVLVFPLHQRDGRNAVPVVAPGDPVLQGQVIARDERDLHPPLHASSSGVVRAIELLPLPHPSGLAGPCLVIDTDGRDAALPVQGLDDYRRHPPEALRRIVHEAGIVGLGGAGFPTALKLAPNGRRIDTLILNGAECEPYITCDDILLRHDPEAVLHGAAILRHLLGAERCLLALEQDQPEAYAAIERALRNSPLPGGEGPGVREQAPLTLTLPQREREHTVEIARVPAIYPTGGEKQLIQVLTGREVPAGGLPADVGVICLNVGTAAAVHEAVAHGRPLVSRIVTVTGQGVRQPQNLLARIGTPIADLIEQCGGYTDAAERLILGGPLMGYALPRDDLPLVKSANCILVAGRDERAAGKQPQPCIRCGACADACPMSLLPQQLYWYSRAEQWDRATDYRLSDCIECGCCDVVCPSHIPLVQYFRAAKGTLAARQREREQAAHAKRRFEARAARREQEQRERAESARRKKESLSKGAAPEIRQAIERAKQKQAAKAQPHSPSGSAPPAEPETGKTPS
jgi:electron transport complex protein RnfC